MSALHPALTLTAAVFPHSVQSSLKLYVSLPLWNLSIAMCPENRGGDTFCTFLSDTFTTTPPAESAATGAHGLQPCISSFKPTQKQQQQQQRGRESGERSHYCNLYLSCTKLQPARRFPAGRAHPQ